jgi:putative exporter of polyketide antibiotics
MSSRTIFLSRLIGLYCILIALSMMTRKQATLESVAAVLRDPSMMFVLGAMTLVAGLAMVLAHNIWSGGVLAVVVNSSEAGGLEKEIPIDNCRHEKTTVDEHVDCFIDRRM